MLRDQVEWLVASTKKLLAKNMSIRENSIKLIVRNIVIKNTLCSVSLLFLFSHQVFASTQIEGRCYQGICFDFSVGTKKLIKKTKLGSLYEVNIQTFQYSYNQPERQLVNSGSQYALCSTKKPAIIFPSYDKKNYIVHLLNPGVSYVGYNLDSYKLYWFICHDLVNRDLFGDKIKPYARRLGYNGQLKEEQISVKNPLQMLP